MSRSVVSKMDDASQKEANIVKFSSDTHDDEENRDGDEGNVEETRSQALIHAKNCQDSFCSKPFCHQMKKYLRHIDKCQDYESCLICPKIYAYDRFHSQYCSKSEKCVIDSRSCTYFSSHQPQENSAQVSSKIQAIFLHFISDRNTSQILWRHGFKLWSQFRGKTTTS